MTETPMLTFSGSCPAGSTGYHFGFPGGGASANVALDPSLAYSSGGWFANNFGLKGTLRTFSVVCAGAGGDTTASADFTGPNYAATVTVPVTIALDKPLSITGTCGGAPGVTSILIRYFDQVTQSPVMDTRSVTDGGPFAFSDLSTPSQLGFLAGGAAQLGVYRETPGAPGGSYARVTSDQFTITAATPPVVIDPPATGPAATAAAAMPKSLARTGMDDTAPFGCDLKCHRSACSISNSSGSRRPARSCSHHTS